MTLGTMCVNSSVNNAFSFKVIQMNNLFVYRKTKPTKFIRKFCIHMQSNIITKGAARIGHMLFWSRLD